MFKFRSYRHAIFGAVVVSLVCALLTNVHLQINYEPELRQVIWKRANLATLAVSFPVSLLFIWEMRKNTLLTDELKRLVERDRLTNVGTRDFFFAKLERDDWAYGVSLMVDIDHFKNVNDTYGHMVGDQVIQSVAQVLETFVRKKDLVCRFGGEEFVIFLFDTDAAKGFQIAERMRRAIAREKIEVDGKAVSVTVSIGGSLKERLFDINKTIREADEALYRAKAAGRNRTVFGSMVA